MYLPLEILKITSPVYSAYNKRCLTKHLLYWPHLVTISKRWVWEPVFRKKFHSHSCHSFDPIIALKGATAVLEHFPYSSHTSQKKKVSWPFNYPQYSLPSCCCSLLPLFQQVVSTLALFGGSGMNSGLVLLFPSVFQYVAWILVLFHWALEGNMERRAGKVAECRKFALRNIVLLLC